jgi:microcystin-dependent protein
MKGRIQMLFNKSYLPLFLSVLVLAIFGSLTLFTPTEASEPAAPLAAYDCGYFVGEIRMWSGSDASVPNGWLIANGQAISRSQYDELFGVIGTTYGGGDGSTTFNVPNLSGRFPLGVGGSHGRSSTGGQETVTLTESQMPRHRHGPGYASNFVVSAGSGSNQAFAGGSYGYWSYPYTGYSGGNAAHENMPPYVTLYYIIRVSSGHQQ